MEIDWGRLGELVKEDCGDTKQADYGRDLGGLSQGQVSDLINGKMRRLTHQVGTALRARFGELPTVQPLAPDEEVRRTLANVEKELRRALGKVQTHRRAQIIRHIEQQVRLIADLAAGHIAPVALPDPSSAVEAKSPPSKPRRKGTKAS